MEADPNRLGVVNQKLQILNNLLQKHSASDVAELIRIREDLSEKVAVTENLDSAITEKESELSTIEKELNAFALKINQNKSNSWIDQAIGSAARDFRNAKRQI